MLKAAHALHPTIPETGWEMLDVLGDDLIKGRSHPYWKYQDEYNQLQDRLRELRRVYNAIQKSKEKWVECGRAFVQREIDICTKDVGQIEQQVTPTHLAVFLSSQLSKAAANGLLVPGRGLEIRLPGGSILELIDQFYVRKSSWQEMNNLRSQALRYASFCNAIMFLEHLPSERVKCVILRETGSEEIDFFENGIMSNAVEDRPSQCVAYLKSREGRAKAHRKNPPYNEQGEEIPV